MELWLLDEKPLLKSPPIKVKQKRIKRAFKEKKSILFRPILFAWLNFDWRKIRMRFSFPAIQIHMLGEYKLSFIQFIF